LAECSRLNGLTSMTSRLVSPTHTGRIQMGSGKVRSGNQRVPPAASSDCRAAGTLHCETQSTRLVQTHQLTRLIQTEVPEGQRKADPQGQLDPDQKTGFEGVTVVSDVELRDDAAQTVLELKPGIRDEVIFNPVNPGKVIFNPVNSG